MELSTPLGVLAQGPNLDQWGDILVIALMAALWLAGGLAKVITGRKGARQSRRQETEAKQQGAQRETWQDRLARKAREFQQAVEAKAQQSERAAQASSPVRTGPGTRVPPQPPAGKITIRHSPKGDAVMVYERPVPRPAADQNRDADRRREEAQRSVARAGQQIAKAKSIAPPGESLAETPTHPQELSAVPPASPMQPASAQAADIIDYDDPDALKTAVLHYEILGKPLALRGPIDEASGF